METKAQSNTELNHFKIGDKLYHFNLGMEEPLIAEFIVKGVIHTEYLYYTADQKLWIRQDHLYTSREDAYKSLIAKAESELKEHQLYYPEDSQI